ncbi:uncharacterized protein HMPREF1541_10761 [Cyphellophora europaea CBS 101466]|uniref:Uncharacterized protein n=1 Tax=Cyphellophora europaea (strain CBS 101466) TaxID=1220924 RepID=W2S6F5_CYPE1|nr:uncharacterized protein HMPREF1541_10761 [Cyphellophora europaea CBS 101466]ETN44210.1 hypothetical protein HMPREF1541_10761 [Cyphellophora europaea CBS 101466]
MRLLRCISLELEEFYDSDIPPYAILSHTWDKGQEVSFQEAIHLANAKESSLHAVDAAEKIKAKSGYHKIIQCARQAANDGLDYVWIDTCAIDKSSSAELSEAINSMYEWYQKSEVCYAHLADVLESRGEIEEQLAQSRWFRRGWCLQELLAPRRVRFFGRDWVYLGDKAGTVEHASSIIDLSRSISEITGIDGETLRDGNIERASVAKKMSWAARRQTSRREDMAYCLLGLFNINMPLLYGEGDKAFTRLQEEIIKTSADYSIFAWRNHKNEDPRVRYSGMLAPSVHAFVDAGSVIPVGTTRPYAMTNIGLRIELPLRNASSSRNRVICVLDCRFESGPSFQRLGVYLSEPWTFNSDIFSTSELEGRVHSSPLHELQGLARDNGESSPVATVELTVEESHRPRPALYVRNLPMPPDAKSTSLFLGTQQRLIYLRKIPIESHLRHNYPSQARELVRLWPLDAQGMAGIVLQPRRLGVDGLVLVLVEYQTEDEKPPYILQLATPGLFTQLSLSHLTTEKIAYMLSLCHTQGTAIQHGSSELNEPMWLTCKKAKRSFGDVLVVDLHDDLLNGLLAPGSIPAVTLSGVPTNRNSGAASQVKPLEGSVMPFSMCLRIQFSSRDEFNEYFGT